MKAFVDTSGWVALFDKADKYHRRTVKEWNKLQGRSLHLLTSDYIIDETLTHLSDACGRHVAVSFGGWLLRTNYIEIARVDETMWDNAWQMFQVYDDKEWSFTDCVSFNLMQAYRLWVAFTFDHHFEQAGFQLWPR